MKKICICTTASVTQKCFVLPTVKYLSECCDYEITLVCAPDDAFAAQVPAGIRFKPVPMARGIDLRAVRSVAELTRFFRREKFDMVQYSTPNASLYASVAARLARVPIRLYCQWGIRYTGMHGMARRVFKQLEKLTCALSTDIRSVSPLNRQFAVTEGLYPDGKATVVGNGGTVGVDMSEYAIAEKSAWSAETRKRLGLGENDFVFGFSGRISRDKGSEELIRAFRRFDAGAVRLVIIGKIDDHSDVDPGLTEFLKTSPRVVCTGWVDNREMKRYYAAMDVLVHPTYREGFGMVIQEAGALGVPCITTRIIGASEVMTEGESCLLVEPKDADGLYDAMNRLYGDSRLTEALGAAAYRRTKALYERSIMLENLRKDYAGLLGE